jgi:antitoxin component HigA of HigAB toxin-antitoxin module
MTQQYPNLSRNLKILMEIYELDDSALSAHAEIKIYDIKRILAGETDTLSFRRIAKLSKVFSMPMNLFIDFISL